MYFGQIRGYFGQIRVYSILFRLEGILFRLIAVHTRTTSLLWSKRLNCFDCCAAATGTDQQDSSYSTGDTGPDVDSQGPPIACYTDTRRNPVICEVYQMFLDDNCLDTQNLSVAGLGCIRQIRIIVPPARGIDTLQYAEMDAKLAGELKCMRRISNQRSSVGVTIKSFRCRHHGKGCPTKVRIKAYVGDGGMDATIRRLLKAAGEVRECDQGGDLTIDTTCLQKALLEPSKFHPHEWAEIVTYGGDHNCNHNDKHVMSADTLVTFAQAKCVGGFPNVKGKPTKELAALFRSMGLPREIEVTLSMWTRVKQLLLEKVQGASSSEGGAISTAPSPKRSPAKKAGDGHLLRKQGVGAG